MAHCRSCGAHIDWAETPAGRKIPIEKMPGGNLSVDDPDGKLIATVVGAGRGSHVAHFALCPNADEHRKTKSR
jgi:hypothetical protein